MLLTKADRCDHRDCGAQAMLRLKFTTGVLDFCGHHYASLPSDVLWTTFVVDDARQVPATAGA